MTSDTQATTLNLKNTLQDCWVNKTHANIQTQCLELTQPMVRVIPLLNITSQKTTPSRSFTNY